MNSVDALEMLEEKGVPLDEETTDGRNALHFLPKNVSHKVVQYLLRRNVNPNSSDGDGLIPLHKFMREEISGNVDVLKLLATKDTISTKTKDGYTALLYAIRFPSLNTGSYFFDIRAEYISALLTVGADINSRTPGGVSALQLLFGCCRQLLDKQGDDITKNSRSDLILRFLDLLQTIIRAINDKSILDEIWSWGLATPTQQQTLLCWAISIKNDDIVELLLSKGADVDLYHRAESPDISGYCALQMACHAGTTKPLFDQLLSLSSRKHEYDSVGYNLAHIACVPGSPAKKHHLKAISEAGVDINQHQLVIEGKVPRGLTPLMLAARGGNAELVSELLELGADVTTQDYFGWVAVHYAIFSRRILAVKAFIGSQVGWNATVTWRGQVEIQGCNALHFAILGGSADIVRYVLSNSFIAHVNARTMDGYSALHLATRWSTPEIMEALLAAKADIEAKCPPHDYRAVHAATFAGRSANLQLLLRHGCSVAADNHGITPELYAIRSGNQEIIRILREHTTRQGTQYLPHCNVPISS